MSTSKHTLRLCLKTQRDQLSQELRVAASHLLVERFFQNWQPRSGHIIAGYYPIGSELSPLPLLEACHRQGAIIALPRTAPATRQLTFVPWLSEDGVIYSGIIPQPKSKLAPVLPHYILVPLLGVDNKRHRLGYGGGYYDFTLAQLPAPKPLLIGIGYACQQLDVLPTDSHDVVLDHVLLV
jgi:5-formyltetrahydrofolate cyclo-ligase